MMPGMGRMNPKQVKQMMRRMGMDMEEIPDVTEVLIRTKSKDLVIKNASVTVMNIKGQVSYQITGEAQVVSKEGAKPTLPAEDIALVASQANCSEEEARAALEECDGNPAEAIIKLMSK
jgi:nascent polypeptide-associated complex subunit alpha